jgi:hypothetical protein
MRLLATETAASAALLILNYVFHYSFREAADHSQSKAIATAYFWYIKYCTKFTLEQATKVRGGGIVE